jgi:hypothetical protein
MECHAARALLLIALTSCSTLQETPSRSTGDTADHVIVFGSLRVDSLLMDQPIDRVLIVQVDPAFPRAQIEPTVEGNMFFTEPLPVGPRWRIASVFIGDEELELSFDFCPSQPGLLFLGSLEIPWDDSRRAEVHRVSGPSERQLLQWLLDAWRGTAWEAPLRYRIRESDHFSQ